MRPILTAVLLFYCSILRAGTISGVVKSADSKPLSGATALLMNSADSSLIKTGLTDNEGRFSFEPTSAGSYIVKIIAAGFEPVFTTLAAYTSEDIVLPDVNTARVQKALKEVTVRSQKPLIEVRADKLVMNVESSITNTGSTAFEILQRAPGVTIDQNDNIAMKGKSGVNIMIDGKLLPISGQDLANMLKAMPSGSVDQIELITNPGARYDAAGTAGIINIRTKRDKRIGVNGNVTAGYGQGVYAKANSGFGLNYRGKKIALYTNYNYAYRRGFNNLDLMRRFYSVGMFSSAFDQHDDMNIDMRSQYASLGADYTLSSKTTIGTVVTGGLNGFDLSGNNSTTVLDASETPASTFYTDRNNSNGWNNWGVNLNLRHRFDSTGSDLSVDADYARYVSSNDQRLFTSYQFIGGGQQQPDYLLYGTLSGYTDIKTLKADYSKPINKTLRLEAGVKTSFVKADNNPLFYNRSGGGNVYDSGKSNHSIYEENINAAYLNAANEGKWWSIQAGLRAEQTIAKGHQLINDDRFDRSYAQLFPSVAATRHLNPKNDLGLTVSRRIERPTYQQLNPFRRYLDISSVNQGNPYLLPALTWSAELTHTWNGKYITQLSWSRTTDVIVQVIQPEGAQLSIVTDKNLAINTVYNFSGSYPLQPFKWWNSVNNFNLFYSHYEGNLALTPLSDGIPTFNLYSQNTFTLPQGWSAEFNGWYQSEQLYGYMHIDQQVVLSIRLQKQLLDKRATLKLKRYRPVAAAKSIRTK